MFDTKTNVGNQEGVSPVIGVILMVAITVILAAVIGTFVLGFADQLQQNPQAVVTFDEDTAATSLDVRLSAVQAADSIWVSSGDLNDSAFSGGENVASGPGGGADGSFLLNRDDDGGVGTVVTVDYSDGSSVSGNTVLVQVLGEVGGNETVIQDQTTSEVP